MTVFMKNVDFWDALRIILESRDLAYAGTADLVTVMTAQDYERTYGRAFAARTEFRAFGLKHARAAHAKTLLEPFRSRVGTLVVNEITNTLQAEDTPDALARMEKMIAEFDRPVATLFAVNHGSVEDILPKLTPLVSRDYGNVQADKRTNTIVMTDNPARLDEAARPIESFDVGSGGVDRGQDRAGSFERRFPVGRQLAVRFRPGGGQLAQLAHHGVGLEQPVDGAFGPGHAGCRGARDGQG
ncbi:MAG: hypothetical protein IPP70_00125 [Elusimicrobia bacterium]|nr:hypothetical protein [Elusimicrobiota bacterium]